MGKIRKQTKVQCGQDASTRWAAATRFPNLSGPRSVGFEFRHFAEALGEALQQFPMERRLCRREAVMTPKAGLAGLNQIGLAQVGQVPGNTRLRGLEDFHDVSDAEFPVP
jgi:hypothetical protein